MKSIHFIIISLGLALLSCSNDDDDVVVHTGNLIVTSVGANIVNGKPVNQLTVGLFDISASVTNDYFGRYALYTKDFNDQGTVEFEGLNPGNYVVAIISMSSYRKTAQVNVGKTTTVNIFR